MIHVYASRFSGIQSSLSSSSLSLLDAFKEDEKDGGVDAIGPNTPFTRCLDASTPTPNPKPCLIESNIPPLEFEFDEDVLGKGILEEVGVGGGGGELEKEAVGVLLDLLDSMNLRPIYPILKDVRLNRYPKK